MGGLREVLIDEIDALRNGTIEPARAYATAKLAQQIITSVALELQAAGLFAPQRNRIEFSVFGIVDVAGKPSVGLRLQTHQQLMTE